MGKGLRGNTGAHMHMCSYKRKSQDYYVVSEEPITEEIDTEPHVTSVFDDSIWHGKRKTILQTTTYEYHPNMKVSHTKFGNGIIAGVKDDTVYVYFENAPINPIKILKDCENLKPKL